MASDPSGPFWIVSAVTAIPAALASFPMERRRQSRMPGTMPYTWGIYVGLNILLLGAFIGGAGIVVAFSGDSEWGASVLLGGLGALYAAAGYYAIRRSRVGLVLATVLSLNIVWWIANALYVSHRWREFNNREGHSDKLSPPPLPIGASEPMSTPNVVPPRGSPGDIPLVIGATRPLIDGSSSEEPWHRHVARRVRRWHGGKVIMLWMLAGLVFLLIKAAFDPYGNATPVIVVAWLLLASPLFATTWVWFDSREPAAEIPKPPSNVR